MTSFSGSGAGSDIGFGEKSQRHWISKSYAMIAEIINTNNTVRRATFRFTYSYILNRL